MNAMPHTARMTGALDPRSAWQAEHCSIARALEIVGTKSALLLLREAVYGTTRFDDFAERVGLSDAVVAARLGELVADGLLAKVPYRESGRRARQGYELTEMGASLVPVLVALMQWADAWYPDEVGYVELRHRDCGARVESELRCAHGHTVDTTQLDLAAVAR